MQKVLLITTFRNLVIDGVLDKPFPLMPGIEISNSEALKIKIVDSRVAPFLGIVEIEYLLSAPNIVSCEFDPEHLRGGDLEPFLLAVLLWIKSLFRSGWVLFDHNFECDSAYLFHIENDEIVRCTSNFLAQRNSRADCSLSPRLLTMDDLVKWERMEEAIGSYLHEQDSDAFRFMLEKGYCRTGRALQFIESARASLNTGFKISHYISAFEALFSTSSSELSHKLSERVAFFLNRYGHEKKEVFGNIKAAYEIRSKLVHGADLSKSKIEASRQISTVCDSYLREIMQLAFGEENLKRKIDVPQDKLEKYFYEMIFG